MKKLLMPDLYYESVFFIDNKELKRRGIEGIIIDIDNTLVPWDVKEANAKVINFIDDILQQGFKVCIISNNTKKRVDKFNEMLRLPSIHRAGKPKLTPYLKAMKLLNTNKQNTAVIGDQLFTDVLGGNRLGLFTILVAPMSSKEFIWTRFVRKLERIVLNNILDQNCCR